jgi:PAS domain S-box-containing protein
MWANAARTRPDATNVSFRTQRPGRGEDENPYATVVRETSIATIITDPNGVDNPIVFANSAFCRMTGYRLGEIFGRNCRFLQGPDTDIASVARISMALRARKPIGIDIRNYRKNGSQFLNRLLVAPAYTESGSLAYFFGTQIDMTAGLEPLEAALMGRKRVAAALEHLHAVEAVCHLAGGIAHNFDNLLGGIRGSLEMLQRNIGATVSERPVRVRSASPWSAQT